MKKICLILLFVLLLSAASCFAATTTQRIFIPYAIVGDGYWSGLVIHNTSNSAMTFIVCAYTNTGEGHYGTAVVDVQPHAMEARAVENFLGSHVLSGQMSLQILTTTNTPFQATLFIGSEKGFGFQNYKSEDYLGWVY